MGKELVTRIWLALLIGISVTSVLSAQPSGSAAMESLNGGDTLRAAHLTRAQFQRLFEQLEVTAFDEPESWEKEIRIRRVHLGRTEGLVVQGTNLLCGATGNCQTWLFRRRGITWLPMFRGYAPVIDGFRLEKQAHNGMKDLSVSINVSADVTRYVSFYYDGIEYREERCDESSKTDDGTRKTRRVQCDWGFAAVTHSLVFRPKKWLLRMKFVRKSGLAVFIVSFILAITFDYVTPIRAAVTNLVPGHACERTYVRRLTLSHMTRPDTLIVRASGPSCAHAKIVVSVRAPSGDLVWSEWVYLSKVEFGQAPDEDVQEIGFERVIGLVENWASVENTAEAPPWVDGAFSRAPRPASEITQYDTKLSRRQYEQIRAAREPMLCIPIGPESAHCIAANPTTQTLVEFLSRGV